MLKSFDVFVMSSVTDALRTAVLEAMACARPVVASRTDSVAEAMEDGVDGFLVASRSAEALADPLIRLLKDPSLRKRVGQAARARIERQFTAERMVDQTLAVYESLVTEAESDRRAKALRYE
jgi:glycosyltransferase involved in cell wall biosynthesis